MSKKISLAELEDEVKETKNHYLTESGNKAYRRGAEHALEDIEKFIEYKYE